MASESSKPTANGVLSFLGVTMVLFVVTIVAIGLLRISGTGGETLEQRRAAGRIAVRNRLDMEAQEKLHSEGWVDKAKGLVHVSITDAMLLTVAELRSKKPAPSQVKVEPPLLRQHLLPRLHRHPPYLRQLPPQFPLRRHLSQSPSQFPRRRHPSRSPRQCPHRQHPSQSLSQCPRRLHPSQSPLQLPCHPLPRLNRLPPAVRH